MNQTQKDFIEKAKQLNGLALNGTRDALAAILLAKQNKLQNAPADGNQAKVNTQLKMPHINNPLTNQQSQGNSNEEKVRKAEKARSDGLAEKTKKQENITAEQKEKIKQAQDKLNELNPEDCEQEEWDQAIDNLTELIAETNSDLKKSDSLLIRKLQANDTSDLTATERKDLEQEAKQIERKKADIKKANASFVNLQTMADFEKDLIFTVKTEVARTKQTKDTYIAPNKRHYNDGVIAKGQVIRHQVEENAIPKIRMYIDCSGSWEQEHRDKATKALHNIQHLHDEGKIDLAIRYFADTISNTSDNDVIGGGTHAWPLIRQEIIDDKIDNVCIVTDTDMNHDARNSQPLSIPGVVWWIWKDANWVSDVLPRVLKGEKGNFQYNLER